MLKLILQQLSEVNCSLYFQAIEVLERATRVKPIPPMFILLGKTNMKAKRFEDAIRSFDRAIEIMVCEASS